MLNILSVLAWVSFPTTGAYCAAKSAEWSLTNALRQELAGQGTRVSALHVGTWTRTWRGPHGGQVRPGRDRAARAGRHRGGRHRDHRRRDQQARAGRPVRRRRRPVPPGRLTGPAKACSASCPGALRSRAQDARLRELGLNTDSDLERSLGRRIGESFRTPNLRPGRALRRSRAVPSPARQRWPASGGGSRCWSERAASAGAGTAAALLATS